MTAGGGEPPSAGGAPTCYRHAGRETYIRCQRCERPICPDCMRDAAVGFQCPECVSQGARETRQHQAAYGGSRSGDPRLTSIALIVVNVAVWLGVISTGGGNGWLTRLLALLPAGQCSTADHRGYYPSVDEALCSTQSGTSWVEGVASGGWWQVVTSGFTHVEPMHIGFNMLALWFLGPQLEGVVGRARFLAVYFGSLLTASAAVMLAEQPEGSTLGASGAVFRADGRAAGGGLQGACQRPAAAVVGRPELRHHLRGQWDLLAGPPRRIPRRPRDRGDRGVRAARAAYAPIQWGGVGTIVVLAVVAIVARALVLA